MNELTATSELLHRIIECGLLSEQRLDDAGISDDWTPVESARKLVRDRLLTPFQARTLLSGVPHPFFLTDRYKILEHLGRGGMGEVFLAEHLLLRRVVAVKVILTSGDRAAHTLAMPGAIERFFREARAVAALDHPNVVRVFDMDVTPIGPCLVMEYVDGTNLHAIVGKFGSLAVARGVDAIVQAANGLEHAHDAGLIHRDVKPGNLLVDRSGTVKVVDLGLARHRDIEMNDGLTGMYDDKRVIGTADFQSPEQGLDSGSADARSDVYSLACTAYYLLTGQVPFTDSTITSKLLAHQMKPAPLATLVRPDVPHGLAVAIQRGMAKRPADRPQDMSEFRDSLAPWLPAELPPPPAAEMPKHPPSAYRLGLCPPPTGSAQRITAGFTVPLRNGPTSNLLLNPLPSTSRTGPSTRGPSSRGPMSRIDRSSPRMPAAAGYGGQGATGMMTPVQDLAPIQLADEPMADPTMDSAPPSRIAQTLARPLSRRTILLGLGGGLLATGLAGGLYL